MKLSLIFAAVFGLVVYQVQAFAVPSLFPTDVMDPPPKNMRTEIVDAIIGRIQEIVHNIVVGLDRLKKPLKDSGFTSLATFLDNIIDGLSQFSDNIGSLRSRINRPPLLALMCQFYSSRPECQGDHGAY